MLHNTALSGRENVAFIARIYGAAVRPTTRSVEDFAELGAYFRYYGANPCILASAAARPRAIFTLPAPPQAA